MKNAKDPKVQSTQSDLLKEEALKRSAPQQKAGGIPAVTNAFKHLSEEMGLINGFKTMLKVNQKHGFDCPGCAWPDPDDKRSLLAEYCENGAKAVAEEATRKRVGREFFAKHSVEELVRETDHWIGKTGRLTEPMVLREGGTHYESISWKDAFGMIAEKLKGLNSPDEAIFYTSGRTSNEAAFLYQLLVRKYGTNNLPDCSNMCHESSGQGLAQTVGIGKGSVTLEDLHEAKVIMVVGQNPGTNHPRMLSALQKCKRNGGKIITVNPIPEAGLIKFQHPQSPRDILGGGTSLTDIFLQVQVNGDVALAKAIMLLLLEAEEKAPGTVLDQSFIQDKTAGYEELIADLKAQDFDSLVAQSGVPLKEIQAAADLLIQHKKIIICWAMGLTQHKNGVQNIREMVNMLLLKGSIGKPGAGTCPVRGHSNVQGDRTMGIWENPKPVFLDKLKAKFDFEPPREMGFSVVPAIQAMHEGKGKVFIAMGGNFLSATPDTAYTAEALRNCELTVQVSTKLNRSHLVHGKEALILPCLGRTEIDLQDGQAQFVSVENSMGKVHSSQGHLQPASEHLKSEVAIICELAEAIFERDENLDWEAWSKDYGKIRDLIESCIPGFEQYNDRVADGFYLPNGAREGKFNTPSGKAHFTINPVPEIAVEANQYLMMTVRSHDQYNTTIYGLDDRYRGIKHARRVVMMHPEDIAAEGLEAEQWVDLFSHYKGQTRTAPLFRVVPYPIARGCVATYFPEANPLVPVDYFADGSHTPASKSVVVSMRGVE